MGNGKTCSACKHFNPVAGNLPECRRWPPKMFLIALTEKGPAFQTRYPNPHPTWGCGEWSPGIVEATAIPDPPTLRRQ